MRAGTAGLRTVALGAIGERVAEGFLEAAGMPVAERDVRLREGQIDLVAEAGGRLALVEVKARRGHGFGLPEEAVGPRKLLRLRRLAAAYARERHLLLMPRVDVVAVDLDRDGRPTAIRHIRDVLG